MPQTREYGEVETVVRSHAEWVHACANRRVGNEAMAEDVTQAVFILLWRKWGRLGKEVQATGWLYRAVRYCAARALRNKRIRERHEREAAMAGLRDRSNSEATWGEVSPELEGAVDRLSERDRVAVLLRFYRQMSFAEVGQALGIGEKAAQKRVERAVGKLREKLADTGVGVEAGSLGAMVLAHAAGGGGGMEGGAAGLVEKVMAGIGGGAGNGTAGLIAKGAMKMMVWAKVKVAAVISLALVLAGSGVVMRVVAADPAVAEGPATMPAATSQQQPKNVTPADRNALAKLLSGDTTPDVDATNRILLLARDRDPYTRGLAMAVVGRHRLTAGQEIIASAAFLDSHSHARRCALYGLALLSDAQELPMASEGLKDSDPSVVEMATFTASWLEKHPTPNPRVLPKPGESPAIIFDPAEHAPDRPEYQAAAATIVADVWPDVEKSLRTDGHPEPVTKAVQQAGRSALGDLLAALMPWTPARDPSAAKYRQDRATLLRRATASWQQVDQKDVLVTLILERAAVDALRPQLSWREGSDPNWPTQLIGQGRAALAGDMIRGRK